MLRVDGGERLVAEELVGLEFLGEVGKGKLVKKIEEFGSVYRKVSKIDENSMLVESLLTGETFLSTKHDNFSEKDLENNRN
jgi:hypothetical protein